jgi:hypothetical protein
VSRAQRHAKSTTQPQTGSFATLSNPLRGSGTGAPTHRPSARHRATLAALALAIAAFAITAAPASAAPEAAKVESISNVSYTSAHLTGKVSSTGCGAFGCFGYTYTFQYSTDQTNWEPGFSENIGTGEANEKLVEGNITVPKGATEYFVRLQVSANAGAQATSPLPNPSFTTLAVAPPTLPGPVEASGVFSTSASASGEVERPANTDPAFNVTACNFEYVSDAQFEENVNVNSLPGFAGATVVPCEQATPFETPAGKTHVTAPLTGLSPSTSYHLRLAAEDAAPIAATKEAAAPFTTGAKVSKPAVISTDDATEVTVHEAKVKGEVQRPAGADPALDVNCRFEYVSDAQFTATGFAGAASTPCAENPITAATVNGEGKQEVSAELGGLKPATTFHLRLAAENSGGTETKDAADTFTTVPAELPTVTIDPVAGGTFTTAHVSGTVDIDDPGHSEASVWIEISSDGGATWSSTIGADPPLSWSHLGIHGQGSLGGGGGLYVVEYNFSGLQPSTTYHFRMASTYSGGAVQESEANGEVGYSPGPNPSITTEPASAPPTASLDPITPPSGSAVHISGTVDPHAPAGPLSQLAKNAYKTNWHFECTPECIDPANPGLSGTVQGEEGAKAVSVDAIRLQPNTFYEVKLTATNEGGTETTAVETFQTPLIPATVKAEAGASDGEGGYIVQGVINSDNSKITFCEFEYGTTATYPNTYKAPCLPAPSGPDEVQNLTVEATEGQFKLSFRGQTTSDLPFNATSAEVQTALRALSSIGSSGVDVTGTPGAYVITFAGKLAGANIEPLKASDGATPLGGGGGASVSTATEGGIDHPVAIEAHLENLTVGAHYHFRIFVTNAAGSSSSADREFIPTVAEKGPPCENETLREENSSLALPECRAFEMVSPAAKEGYGAGLVDFDGGAAVAYSSNAGNIANSGLALGSANLYTAIRTTAGWQTRANLNGPSGSAYDGPEGVGLGSVSGSEMLSKDLLSSVWMLGKPKPGLGPYLRKPDGSFVSLGNASSGYQSPPVGQSADLSHVVYDGGPDNAAGISTVYGPGVYEYIGTGNDPIRVDVDNAGDVISGCLNENQRAANGNAVSSDGDVIVFSTNGTNGTCANTPHAGFNTGPGITGEIWARVNGTTSFDASASLCTRNDCNAPAAATFQSATPDGSRIFFTTTQQLLNSDTDETSDLYACDIPAGNPAPTGGPANPCSSLTEISDAATGADVQNVVAGSEDGSTILFNAKGVLAHNPDAFGEEAVAGDNNLYVWRQDTAHPAGQTTFIAPNVGGQAQATPDGRYLALDTATPLLPTDTDNAQDVYRYDADSGQLIRASTGPTGTGGNADSFDASFAGVRGVGVLEHNPHYAISDDGQKIVFNTAEGLSPLDGNGGPDIYLWTPGRVSDISLGSGEQGVIDGSGKNIYFQSGAVLTPGDGDQQGDVYDARVLGGFSFAEPTCSGEGCQSAASGPPASPAPVTGQSPADPGNIKPCPKAKVAKGNKCVKKHKKHSGKKHHGKKAGHKQGGGK